MSARRIAPLLLTVISIGCAPSAPTTNSEGGRYCCPGSWMSQEVYTAALAELERRFPDSDQPGTDSELARYVESRSVVAAALHSMVERQERHKAQKEPTGDDFFAAQDDARQELLDALGKAQLGPTRFVRLVFEVEYCALEQSQALPFALSTEKRTQWIDAITFRRHARFDLESAGWLERLTATSRLERQQGLLDRLEDEARNVPCPALDAQRLAPLLPEEGLGPMDLPLLAQLLEPPVNVLSPGPIFRGDQFVKAQHGEPGDSLEP